MSLVYAVPFLKQEEEEQEDEVQANSYTKLVSDLLNLCGLHKIVIETKKRISFKSQVWCVCVCVCLCVCTKKNRLPQITSMPCSFLYKSIRTNKCRILILFSTETCEVTGACFLWFKKKRVGKVIQDRNKQRQRRINV